MKSKQEYRIPIATTHSVEIIWVKDILYLEGMENYSRVILANGDSIVSTTSLGRHYEELRNVGFYQCHKSYLVNFEHILRYKKQGDVELITSHQIPIARRRKDLFLDALKAWCNELSANR